jgi:hypothetical protein
MYFDSAGPYRVNAALTKAGLTGYRQSPQLASELKTLEEM